MESRWTMSTYRYLLAVSVLVVVFAAACSSDEPGAAQSEGEEESAEDLLTNYEIQQSFDLTINVTSTTVDPRNGRLVQDHTCEGAGTSPHVAWEGVPAEAKSLALVFEDPASDELGGQGLWTHWVLHSIPPSVTELAVGEASVEVLGNGARHGMNDYDESKYSGPCPNPTIVFTGGTANFTAPIAAKERPYYFRLYALDSEVDVPVGADRDAVLTAIDGHIIAGGVLEMPYKSRLRERRRTVSD